MSVRRRFREAELEAVRQATARAERSTGVEIVAVVVDRADAYEVARWIGASVGAVSGSLAAAGAHLAADVWAGPPQSWILLPPLAGALLGYLAARWMPPLERLLAPAELLRRRAERRAAEAFLAEGVHATVDHTGVLILVALFERRAVVLADRGLADRVPPGSWEAVSAALARGIRDGRPGAALVEAVDTCGRLAEEAGVGRRGDDRNELSDRVRFPDDPGR